MTTTDQLQTLADAWAQKLGGVPVTLNVLVYAGGKHAGKAHYGAYIGELGTDFEWKSFSPNLSTAQDEAERYWRMDGAPVEPEQAERAKLKARAAELGMRILEEAP